MPFTTVSRIKAAKTAIRRLTLRQPFGQQSAKRVADLMGINSAHISHLFMRDYLTPALERGLVQVKALPPRPDPIPTEPCLECGEVHVKNHCIYKRAGRIRRPRFSVAGDDPDMALQQLEKYYPGMFSLREEIA